MNKKSVLISLVLVVVVFSGIYLLFPQKYADGALDSFAQCLAGKGITMYGANWCPHCQNEKKAFGSSFKFVPYVECPENPQACLSAGIEGYPTWIFTNGERLVGEQGIQKLSEKSGCTLPTKS